MDKFEVILRYPISVFNNKYVIRLAIYSCLILYLILAFSNIIHQITPTLLEKNIIVYNVLRDSVYQILNFTCLGYFLSKYKFCYWSLLSFYGVMYLKIVWFVDKYIYSFNKYLNVVDSGITIVTLTMILYFLYTNYKIDN